MKYLLLTLSILLLSSCTQYRYDVRYEKCNGQAGSTSYVDDELGRPDRTLGGYGIYYPMGFINNVCDFSYTRTEIK